MKLQNIIFPEFSGIRCLMMPYIQGETESVPAEYRKNYEDILKNVFIEKGKIGFLTIDESSAKAGQPHRGARAKFDRALHTEAGRRPGEVFAWGGGGTNTWGGGSKVTLEKNTKILLANNLDDSCALWNSWHENTGLDGDIGDFAQQYPYSDATIMKSGEVHSIGILTPHESLPVKNNCNRQFLRIVGSGVHGREEYFTENPLLKIAA